MDTSIHEAKTQLSRLIERAMAGEEVIIARGKQPLVKLVPIRDVAGPRVIGGFRGDYYMSDDFDEPLAAFADYAALPSEVHEALTGYAVAPKKPAKSRSRKA